MPVPGEESDWEMELACVIRKSARYASFEEAEKNIAGYGAVNALGTVVIFQRTDIHVQYGWIGKNQPMFKPAGPFVVPR